MKKSFFVIPLSFIAHILIINITSYVLTPYTYLNAFSILFYNLAWFIATYSLDFYPTARREGFNVNFKNFFKLIIVFGLAYFTSFTFLTPHPYSWQHLLMVYVVICLLLLLFRLFFYWARNLVRTKEYVHTRAVVIGRDKNLKKIRHIFDIPKYGYRYMGYFDNSKSNSPTYLGNIESSYEYIFKNNVEEVYCIASRLSKDEIKHLMNIADNSLKKLKIIPDNKELFSRAMSIELYDSVPVLNLRASPLDLEYSNLIKRIFDIIFSLMVIIFCTLLVNTFGVRIYEVRFQRTFIF